VCRCGACFFFSSRRRHTRFSRDWSSDVCSSDLPGIRVAAVAAMGPAMNEAPVGVFDSGVGGLSVLREIHQLLPAESLLYVADSRSEERRVGKECRARGSAHYERKTREDKVM